MPKPRKGEHRDPLRYSGADFVKQFESEYSFSFDQSLKDCIARAFDASKKPEGDPLGVTTDRVFVSMLNMGKQRPKLAPKAARIYQAVGETDFEKLKLMLTPAGVPSHEVEIELEDGPKVVSDTFRIFLDTAWKNREPKSKELTLDQLADQFIRDPGHVSMRYLFGQTSQKWEDVADTILHLAQASDLPGGHLTAGSGRMGDWTNHLESRYNARFSPDGVELIVAAAAQSQKVPDRRPLPSGILNTRDFLPQFLNDPQLLRSFILQGSITSTFGGITPPWVEELCFRDSDPDAPRAPGNLPFSRHVEEALANAASLVASTPDYPFVNKWHIAWSIISSFAPGITTSLTEGGTDCDHAIEVLLKNMDAHEPRFFVSLKKFLKASNEGSTLSPSLAGTGTTSGLEAKRPTRSPENSIEPVGNHSPISDWTPIEQRIEKLRCNERTIAYVMEMRELCRNHGYTRSLTIEALYSSLLAWDDGDSVFPSFRKNVSNLDQEDHRREFLSTCIHVDAPENYRGVLFVTDPVYKVFETAQVLAEQRPDSRIDPIDIMVVLLVPPKDSRKPAWWFNSLFERENPRLREEFSAALRLHPQEAATPFWLNFLGSPEPTKEGPNSPTESKDDEEETATTGGKHNASRRHHPQELCLDIDRYAEASAQLLKNASDESDFVFGLFGPWGRGKTTLAEEIQARIEPKGYVCVRFCAWRYPTRPEVWVHLYEEILLRSQMRLRSEKERADLESPEAGSLLQRLRMAFRVGVLRQGWGPLILGSILLLVSRLPWLDFSLGVANAIGWSGIILLASFAIRSTSWAKSLRLHYGALPSHREKLGLQSVIGQDLANLLKIWIKPNGVSDPKLLRRFWLLWISAGAACFACILAGVDVLDHALRGAPSVVHKWNSSEFVSVRDSNFSDHIADALPRPIGWAFRGFDNTQFGHLSTGLWIAGILLLIGSGVLLLATLIRINPQSFEKLLLIVDDLDRCGPDEMLAIVESLRVFLEKSEMSRRVQILMLIDDRKLDQAILKRAREQGMLPKRTSDHGNYCREQREKYFVSSIRLLPLDDQDISDVTTKILDREAKENLAKRAKELQDKKSVNKQILARNENDVSKTRVEKPARYVRHALGPGAPKNEVSEIEPEIRRPATDAEIERERREIRRDKANAKAEEEERERLENEIKQRSTSRPPMDVDRETKFTSLERLLLHEWVRERSNENTSPRSIRAEITRYLLARLIISTFGFTPDARSLISALSNEAIEKALEPDELRAYKRVATILGHTS